jgi:TRAP transporter 4TM/12TM fusion protein
MAAAVGEQPEPGSDDSTPRRWRDLLALASLVAIAWSLLQIAFIVWPTIDTLTQRATHACFGVALALLLTERKFGDSPVLRLANRAMALLALAPAVYVALSIERLVNERIYGVDPVEPQEYVLGLILIVLMFEASRRALGWGLTLFAGAFVLYHFLGVYIPGDLGHRFGGLERFVDVQFLTLQGIFGVPVGVSTAIVFYFILFAALYEVFGGGRLIIDLSLAVTGRRRGGPAKAAVVASGFMGSVSGSAVANVMSTGIFTIPLMKRVGYDPRFAGAVEAVASTGGQLMPPVMGAAAFVMADLLQTPYRDIAIAAIIPALLYFAATLFAVDLQARKLGLREIGETGEAPPTVLATMKARGHMLIPLVWLAYRIVEGYPIAFAAVESIVVIVVAGMLHPTTRQGPLAIVHSLAVAAQRSVNVALPCAVAGIVVSIIAFTGLGTKFTAFMVYISGGNVALMLGFAMLSSLVLGAGMPTTSAYIMAAVLVAPALIQSGVEPLLAHFFILYFAILSMLTPPVALAAYAAASISGASASRTGWQAFALALPGFVIPFALFAHPGMLLLGTVADTLWGLANALVGERARRRYGRDGGLHPPDPVRRRHEVIRQGEAPDADPHDAGPDLRPDDRHGLRRQAVFSWGGNPGVGSLHRLRDAVENGWPQPLAIEEHSHAAMANAYDAGAANLPFAVFRGYVGADLPKVKPNIRSITCPFTGEVLGAVPAIRPDVGMIHAQKADREGNVLLEGIVGVQKEAVLARSARS